MTEGILGTERLVKGLLQLSRLGQESGFQNSVHSYETRWKLRGIIFKKINKQNLDTRGKLQSIQN